VHVRTRKSHVHPLELCHEKASAQRPGWLRPELRGAHTVTRLALPNNLAFVSAKSLGRNQVDDAFTRTLSATANYSRACTDEAQRRTLEKLLADAAIAVGLLLSGGLLSDSAWSQTVRIGPGGVRVGPDYDRYERRRWRRAERCRVVIERRRNRFGEMVERRTRVCR